MINILKKLCKKWTLKKLKAAIIYPANCYVLGLQVFLLMYPTKWTTVYMCVNFQIQGNWPMCHRFIRKMITWRKTITGLWAFCHHYLKFMRESWVNNSLIFLTKSSLLCCQLSERHTAVSPPFWIWSSILKNCWTMVNMWHAYAWTSARLLIVFPIA